MSNDQFDFESIIFAYIDELKFLLFPDKWSEAFLDYSKNEFLALIFIYRNKNVNMTEIADYINAPLNTATGVVGRLEKKKMIERRRAKEDRRVVNIVLTEKGEEFIKQQKKIIDHYVTEVYKALTEDEKAAAMSIFTKVISVLKSEKDSDSGQHRVKKVKRIIIE